MKKGCIRQGIDPTRAPTRLTQTPHDSTRSHRASEQLIGIPTRRRTLERRCSRRNRYDGSASVASRSSSTTGTRHRRSSRWRDHNDRARSWERSDRAAVVDDRCAGGRAARGRRRGGLGGSDGADFHVVDGDVRGEDLGGGGVDVGDGCGRGGGASCGHVLGDCLG